MGYDGRNVTSDSGDTTINKDIIYSVVSLATREIAGVASLARNDGSLKNKLSKNLRDGVKITNIDGDMVIDIYISVYIDSNVSDVAFRVQENVKNSLSTMIDMDVTKINVHVEGVEFNKEESED